MADLYFLAFFFLVAAVGFVTGRRFERTKHESAKGSKSDARS